MAIRIPATQLTHAGQIAGHAQQMIVAGASVASPHRSLHRQHAQLHVHRGVRTARIIRLDGALPNAFRLVDQTHHRRGVRLQLAALVAHHADRLDGAVAVAARATDRNAVGLKSNRCKKNQRINPLSSSNRYCDRNHHHRRHRTHTLTHSSSALWSVHAQHAQRTARSARKRCRAGRAVS